MRVAVYYNNRDIRLEEKPIPRIGSGELLVKIMASGICGTDLMEWYRIQKAPRVLGHEITGIISESHSKKYKPGQRVFVSHHVPCGRCRYCLVGNHTACDILHKGNYDPGGYSEFIRVPKINVDAGIYPLPEGVSYRQGVMIEPLACAVRGQRVINVKKGHTVLILGSGVSGLLNIQLAGLKGARVIAADINGYRLKKAKEFGADEILDANNRFDIKADRVIVSTGAPAAVEQAFRSVDRCGTVLFFAIPEKDISIPVLKFWRNELTAVSTYGASPTDIEEALSLIEKRDVDVNGMITHVLPLENIQEGFNIVSGAGESLKIILEPHDKE